MRESQLIKYKIHEKKYVQKKNSRWQIEEEERTKIIEFFYLRVVFFHKLKDVIEQKKK
jgi:hypothetical protein